MDDVETLSRWIAHESPTRVPDAVRAMGALVMAAAAPTIAAEPIPSPAGHGDMLLLRAGPDNGVQPILLIGHLDTVHPIGTLAGPAPLRREGDRLYGPGSYDMKAGVLIALRGLETALAAGTLRRPVVIALSPDEEIGSPFSRAIIERLAREAAYALVLEPARRGGGCVTARKGVARLELTVAGRAAHSGTHHQEGRSAIREAAHQVLAIEAMTDYQRGLTTSVGVIAGGTGPNTVAAECRMSIDVRMVSEEDGDATVAAIRALRAIDPDTRLSVTGGIVRPPFERSAGTQALLALAQRIAGEQGMALPEAPRAGGGSDGNFTAALGVPTLDALGAEGDGAHTHYEHILLSSLPRRIAFLAALLGAL